MAREISNTDNVIDSRDVIKRIEQLERERGSLAADIDEPTPEEAAALAEWDESDDGEWLGVLRKLAKEAEDSPDWEYGETLIRESYFTDYIEELIHDCYELPEEVNSGSWPWRHMQIDYEAAAEEAKADYMEVDFDGVTYLIRA